MKVFLGPVNWRNTLRKKKALVPILAAKGRQETHGTGKRL